MENEIIKQKKTACTNVFSERIPLWMGQLPEKYMEILKPYYDFFVLRSLFEKQSARSKSFMAYGWEFDPFCNNYLGLALTKILPSMQGIPRIAERKTDFLSVLEQNHLTEKELSDLNESRFAVVKASAKKGNNEFMSLFYHIRNALSHGRIGIKEGTDELVFVFEDGLLKRKKAEPNFEVTARAIISKSKLDAMIRVIKKPPKCAESVLMAIQNGYVTKKEIMAFTGFKEEFLWKTTIEKLKNNRRIEYKNNKWQLVH